MSILKFGYFIDDKWLEIFEVGSDNIEITYNLTPTLIPVEDENNIKYYLSEEAFEIRVVYLEPVDLDKE